MRVAGYLWPGRLPQSSKDEVHLHGVSVCRLEMMGAYG